MSAAFEVFAERGFRAGSLQEVADRVGMSQTGLLHYFPRKTDLLLAVLRRRDELSEQPLVSGAFDERVVARARANVDVAGLIELYTVITAEATTPGHPAREYVTDRLHALREDYTDAFTALADAGRLRSGVDPHLAATSLLALWDGAQAQWLLDRDAVDTARVLRAYLDLVIE